ncbi:hypothetical protein [Gottfriedia luciferensis]|uniref:hypothetical protein n=1 Tax=Gottfriedia luciferensis TaxID=178774 RepID=UPI000B44DE9F|nr:hypothetical protein [Gottfriedia luciferensis]
MLEKNKGTINEIIYDSTAYNKGKYRYFPTITDLYSILDKIISSNSTTDYIRITPFYINENLNMQIEFEEYMFYIECRNSFDEKTLEKHILECLDPEDKQRSLEDLRLGSILYPLCRNNDVNSYINALKNYKECLKEILPKMMYIAKSEMELNDEDIAFGYFCFEIHSG